MSNQNYVNYYVEILTSTMHDAIVRNVSLQANARISEEIINELQKKIDELESSKLSQDTEKGSRIKSLEDAVNNLTTEVNQLRLIRDEYDKVKHQVNHVDTFRGELTKAREQIENAQSEFDSKVHKVSASYENKIQKLTEEIEYLKLTPAKRKKIDELKISGEKTDINNTAEEPNAIIKDGGSF